MSRKLAGWLVLQVILAGFAAWAAADRETWHLMVAAAFAWMAVTVAAYRTGGLSAGSVLVIAVVMRVLWGLSMPSLSDDSYRYAWDGLVTLSGQNPYAYVPADSALAPLQAHPVFDLLNSQDYYSVYPPASQLLFAAATWAGDKEYDSLILWWKAAVMGLELLALFWLLRLVTPGVAMLYAFNPVVVIAVAGQGHTDALLALPLVGAVALARSRRWFGAGALVAAAAHIKIWPALAVPAFIHRKRAVAGGLLVGVALAAPFYAPYVLEHVRTSLDLYVRYFEFNAGPYYALKWVYAELYALDWSKQLGPLLRQLFALSVLALWVRTHLSRKKGQEWSLEAVLFWILALHLLTATTVHPWYLFAILLLSALNNREGWAWHWLSVCSIGTYLLYVDGPYWPFVIAGWAGFGIIGLVTNKGRWIEQALLKRAEWKAAWIAPHLKANGLIVDLGGAEGFVGARLIQETGRPVEVLETRDVGATQVPHRLYDGIDPPYKPGQVDSMVSIFTLHHLQHPGVALAQWRALGVQEIVVVESAVTDRFSAVALRVLDPLANSLRSGEDVGSPTFRTASEWRRLFGEAGFRVTAESAQYNPLHRKHLFRLAPAPDLPM